MKRMINCAISALVAAIGLSATAASMTPFDDCVWWFEGGVLTTGEKSRFVKNGTTDLFDITHASTPDGATHRERTWTDLLTGRICALTDLRAVPVWDSPVVLR